MLKLYTAPTVPAVRLNEVKDFMRLETIDDDPVVADIIEASVDYAQDRTGRAFITQTWDEWLDKPPYYGPIQLHRQPVQSITGIYTIAEDGTETTFDKSNYYLLPEKGQVAIKSTSSWPSVSGYRRYDGFKIRYVCGYGDAPETLPHGLKQALHKLCHHWYDSRTAGEPPQAIMDALDTYRDFYLDGY